MLYQLSYASPEVAICRYDEPAGNLPAGLPMRNRLPTRNIPAVLETNVRAHSHRARTTAQNQRLAHATPASKHRAAQTLWTKYRSQSSRSPGCQALRPRPLSRRWRKGARRPSASASKRAPSLSRPLDISFPEIIDKRQIDQRKRRYFWLLSTIFSHSRIRDGNCVFFLQHISGVVLKELWVCESGFFAA